jgi:hypothetical protein
VWGTFEDPVCDTIEDVFTSVVGYPDSFPRGDIQYVYVVIKYVGKFTPRGGPDSEVYGRVGRGGHDWQGRPRGDLVREVPRNK